jgi:2-methylisocitrate lyase-like PEP mutase family enzyme
MTELRERAKILLDLHTAPEILTLTNVWDVASAQAVAGVEGVRALATASHAIAGSFGYEDGENIPLDLHLQMVERIAGAVDLPVSMDFEAGYGNPGETARRAIAAGVVGGNLEDRVKPLDEAVAAVEAVLAAGHDAGIDFVLNARTDVFVLRQKGADRKELMREAVRRGQAFLEAGAPVVFVPGVMTRDEIEILVGELGPQKASLIAVPGVTPPTRELEELGVARVSTGPFTQYLTLNALKSAVATFVGGGALPPEAMPT